jgi:hypothetical protein
MRLKLAPITWVGVIASVIWFNLFVGYFLYYRAQGPNKYYMEARNACDRALQALNDVVILIEDKAERVAKQTENRSTWKKCLDDINIPYRRRIDRIYRRIPFVAAAGLGTVTFGWMIAWFGILIKRRLRPRSRQ